jgi:hypothetical protein
MLCSKSLVVVLISYSATMAITFSQKSQTVRVWQQRSITGDDKLGKGGKGGNAGNAGNAASATSKACLCLYVQDEAQACKIGTTGILVNEALNALVSVTAEHDLVFQRLAAGVTDHIHRILGRLRHDVRNYNPRSLRGKLQGGSATDSRTSPCNQSDSSVDLSRHCALQRWQLFKIRYVTRQRNQARRRG